MNQNTHFSHFWRKLLLRGRSQVLVQVTQPSLLELQVEDIRDLVQFAGQAKKTQKLCSGRRPCTVSLHSVALELHRTRMPKHDCSVAGAQHSTRGLWTLRVPAETWKTIGHAVCSCKTWFCRGLPTSVLCWLFVVHQQLVEGYPNCTARRRNKCLEPLEHKRQFFYAEFLLKILN